MGRNNRNKILVPEARKELDELKARVSGTSNPEDAKLEVAKELGIPLKKGYNGDLTAAQVGKVGGRIDGYMARRIVPFQWLQLRSEIQD